MVKNERTSISNFSVNFVSGGIAASISKTATAPIERIKIILQTQAASPQITTGKQYSGILDALVRIPKTQGFFSFWRGNWANILRYFPLQAFNFAFNDYYKEFFRPTKDDQFWQLFIGNLLSGGCAGATSLSLVYPLDFARTRLAVDVGHGKSREFSGLIDCLNKIYRADGIRGLYRGFLVSVQCIFVYRASYFGVFDTSKVIIYNRNDRRLNFLETWALAQAVTTTSGMIAFPWDTVRRRMMMQSGRVNILYENSWDCVLKMIRNEGMRSFYNGAFTNVIRSVGGALVLAFYDQIKSRIEK